VAAEAAGLPVAASPAGRADDAGSLRLSQRELPQRTSRAFEMRRLSQVTPRIASSPTVEAMPRLNLMSSLLG
jgi:hypothetical protein